MGMFATLKGDQFTKCPKCGGRAEWQSKSLYLYYKGRAIWIGEEHQWELDENVEGTITCYCYGPGLFPGVSGCGQHTKYQIQRGELYDFISGAKLKWPN